MIIEKYNDLKNVEDNVIVDLTKLDSNLYIRALDFLTGLTCKNGELVKIEKQKFLVKLNNNKHILYKI